MHSLNLGAKHGSFLSCLGVLGLLFVSGGSPGADAPPARPKTPDVALAVEGKARLPIFAGSVAEPVQELQQYLKRITGADFAVEKPREKAAGIYVGLAADFPLKFEATAE